jgi:peptide/nickel transport system permease protein
VGYLARMVAKILVVILLVSFGTMILLDLTPGSPGEAMLGEGAQPEQVDAINAQLGVNDPLPERYGDWLHAIFTADLGRSLTSRQPVSDMILERLPVTLELALGSLVVALAIAIPAGVYAAYRRDRWPDRLATGVTSVVLSVPGFALAVLLIYFLAVANDFFPVTNWVRLTDDPYENVRHAFLPVMTLALLEAAQFTRLLRNDMVATLEEDYIRAARSRGLSASRVLLGHALRPSSFSLVTVAGVSLGRLIGGTVIIESVFALPGLGQLALSSITSKDYTVLRAIVLVVAISYVVINALVDVLYHVLDPRVRVQST